MSITAMLLDFLMNLLRDPQAAAAFLKDPQGALDGAGLGSVCTDDVDAVMPVILDMAPVAAISGSVFGTGGNVVGGGDASTGALGGAVEGTGGDSAPTALPPAVQALTTVVNNFSYTSTSVDDRDTVTNNSVSSNVWALGDVHQIFDSHAVVASGDGAAAGGRDATVDNSDDHSTNISAGSSVSIGNTDISLDNAFNDNSDHSDNSDNSVHLNNSLNDSSDHSDNSVKLDNSLNDNSDNSNHSDNSVALENSLNDNSDNSVSSDNSNSSTNVNVNAEFENSFNDQSTNVQFDDLEAQFSPIDDPPVIAHNNVDVVQEDVPHDTSI